MKSAIFLIIDFICVHWVWFKDIESFGHSNFSCKLGSKNIGMVQHGKSNFWKFMLALFMWSKAFLILVYPNSSFLYLSDDIYTFFSHQYM